MNGLTTNRMPEIRDDGRTTNGLPSRYSAVADPDPALEKSSMPNDRLSYLKVLVMSLLREIESLEGTVTTGSDEDSNLQGEVRRFEAELIRNALVRTGGRQRRAARLLGTKVTTLNTKIKRYKIRIDDPATSS
jgi:DNA-binding NtrC family response regulator